MKAVSPTSSICYSCRQKGHLIKDCPEKSEATEWCSYHKSTSHTDGECRRHQQQRDKTKQAAFSDQTELTVEEHSFAFHVHEEDHTTQHHNKTMGLLVDTGSTCTSHIVTKDLFKRVDRTFRPTEHYMELADGTTCKTRNMAVTRGDAEVTLKAVSGRNVKAVLKNPLLIPSYPQDIFSVKAATSNGAELNFRQG